MTKTEEVMKAMGDSQTIFGIQNVRSHINELCASGGFDHVDYRGRSVSFKDLQSAIYSGTDYTHFKLMRWCVEYGYQEHLGVDIPDEMVSFLDNPKRFVKRAIDSSSQDNCHRLFSELIKRR